MKPFTQCSHAAIMFLHQPSNLTYRHILNFAVVKRSRPSPTPHHTSLKPFEVRYAAALRFKRSLGLSRLCSATFEQLLALGITFCGFLQCRASFAFQSDFWAKYRFRAYRISSTKKSTILWQASIHTHLLKAYWPFEHITCHLTTFRRSICDPHRTLKLIININY